MGGRSHEVECEKCGQERGGDPEWEQRDLKDVLPHQFPPEPLLTFGDGPQSGDVAGFKEGTFWKIAEAGVFAPTDDPRRFYFEGWIEKPETIEMNWLGESLEVIPVRLIQEDEEEPVEICGAPPPGSHPEVAPCILAKGHKDFHISGEGFKRFQWPTPPMYRMPKTSYFGDGGMATYPCGCKASWVMAYGNTCARNCQEWHACNDCNKYGHIE